MKTNIKNHFIINNLNFKTMKKHTKILAVAIAAIMTIGSVAFVSCQKEYSTAQNNQTVLSGTNSKAVSFGKKEVAMKLAEMIDADPLF